MCFSGEGCIKVKDCRVESRQGETCEATEFQFYQHEDYGVFCCTLNVDMGEATTRGGFNLFLLISKPTKPASSDEEEEEEEDTD